MQHIKPFFCSFIALISVGCSDAAKTTSVDKKQKITLGAPILIPVDSVPTKAEKRIVIPSNVDDKFENFLLYFNQDSSFQINRIEFPIPAKGFGGNGEIEDMLITKDEFHILDFTYDDSAKQEYKQEIELKGNKATIEVQGIDNGIAASYYFEKKNGQWKLVSWEDYST
jgi:hypothetical protein